MSRKSLSKRRFEIRALLEGLKKELPGASSHLIAGRTYTTRELIAIFAAAVGCAEATDSARAAYHGAVARERGAMAKAHRVREDIRLWLVANHGPISPKLDAFGFSPRKKRKKPSVETTRAAVEKRRATRAARGTMVKRRR